MSFNDTLPLRIKSVARTFPSSPAQHHKNSSSAFQTVSFKEFWERISLFGAGLSTLGIERGTHVGIISDNRPEWLVSDMAILGLGAVDVPRGSDSTKDEVSYILHHADCSAVICEDKTQMEKILSGLSPKTVLKTLIVMDNSLGTHRKGPSSIQLLNFDEILVRGQEVLKKHPDFFDTEVTKARYTDLVTIIYTSGTTGEPKGVMLTHQSFLFQIDRILDILDVTNEDSVLSVLPVWHSFERFAEYIILCKGAAVAYSKPIGKILMEDLAAIHPTYFPSVPRIWESVRTAVLRNVSGQSVIKRGLFHFFLAVGEAWSDLSSRFLGRWPRFKKHWNLPTQVWTFLPLVLLWPFKKLGEILVFSKIKSKLGKRFKSGISGGGALPPYVDKFFRAIGISIIEGYGLTECAPVLSLRLQKKPVPGTVGPLLKDVEYKVVAEDGQLLGPGEKGVLWVKSPQIMLGYYKKPEETAKVLQNGWLNTGDLVRMTVHGEIKIVGRDKDTIVLLGGENIEPEPIETRLLQSEFIDQIMVVGQDQRCLGALIVPNFELLERFASERKISYMEREELLNHAQILEYVHETIQYLINPRTGFKAFERIYKFKLLPKAFQVGVELTQTLKLKRNVIADRYAKEIAGLFMESS